MPKPEIRVFRDLEELSQAAATRFEELARAAARKKGIFSAALSGGSTPRRLFEILAAPPFVGNIPWEKVHLFQVDERSVPPDDPESNYRMTREALLSKAPLPADHFHRMAAERDDRDRASRLYAQELTYILKPPKGKLPRLDLILLGMGPDGHTASLFPGTAALQEKKLWVCANYVEKLKMHRLTLTFPVLNSGANILFLVAGADKAKVVREVLEGPRGRYPAQRVRPARGKRGWFLDEAAANLLRPKTRGGR